MNSTLLIIPAYNEAENIERVVDNLIENYPQFDYVVINDHSTDNTLNILKQNQINYINLPANLGIGGAVQTGYLYAYENGYDTAVQVDADGQHDPKYLSMMLDTMKKENADMIIGSRFIENKGFQSTFARRIGITYFTKLIHMLTGTTITDPTSGLRMGNRKVIELFAKDYPRDYPEPESIVALLKRGMKIKEVPVMMRERQGGVSSINLKKSVYYMVKVTMAILIENHRQGGKK